MSQQVLKTISSDKIVDLSSGTPLLTAYTIEKTAKNRNVATKLSELTNQQALCARDKKSWWLSDLKLLAKGAEGTFRSA